MIKGNHNLPSCHVRSKLELREERFAHEYVIDLNGEAFHIEDLYDLVFPPDIDVEGHLCMVFQCFLDDSKDQDQTKVFVSAGFLGTKDHWSELRVAWRKCLKEHEIDYFKTSEYKMLRGQFAKFKTAAYPPPTGREKANEIRDSLLAIPRNLGGIKGFGLVIPVEDYAKVCARPEAKDFFRH